MNMEQKIIHHKVGLLKCHRIAVNSVAFSPDGRRALSGGGNETIRLWALPE